MAPSVLPIWWCLLCCLCALPAFDTAATDFTNDQKNEFVKAHNRLRQTAVPQVGNMLFVSWNDDLATEAKKAIDDKCTKKEKYITAANKGENVFFEAADTLDTTKIMNHWFGCKNYAENIMWASTDGVGCAHYKTCKIVLCVYNKPTEQKKNGWPCSRCPATFNRCYGGLCATASAHDAIKDASLDAITASDPLPTKTADQECLMECGGSGTRDEVNCKCTCSPITNFGSKCQYTKAEFDASIRLKITSTVANTPVSLSLFNEKVWKKLQDQLDAKAKSHCGSASSKYVICCHASGDHTQKQDAKPYANFKLIGSTIGNDCDGNLHLNVFGEPVKTANQKFCKDKDPIALVPRTVIMDVLTDVLTALSSDLTSAGLTITSPTKAPDLKAETEYPITCSNSKVDCIRPTTAPKTAPDTANQDATNKTTNKPPGNSVPSNPGKPSGNTGAPPPAKDKLASRTATASLALMLISCVCTVTLLCVQSLAF